MSWMLKRWTLVGVLLAAIITTGQFVVAQVTTTPIADTIYSADGSPATGMAIISWPQFSTATGESVPAGSTSVVIAAGGALSVQLAPNAGSNPMGSYYTVVYHLGDGSVSRQYWVVPSSTTPVKVSAIQSTVLPASVAMQTVSKSYVDTAIARAVSGTALDTTTPYVLKAGDTMTGPLVLPADPVSANQAVDKHYVDIAAQQTAAGLAQKVSLLPQATQVVTQPTGTELQVNNLNGVEYADQYVSGAGNNGIANAVASSDCANGCEVKAGNDYNAKEIYSAPSWNSQTHVEDNRRGAKWETYLNPENVNAPGYEVGQAIDVVSTRSGAALHQLTTNEEPSSVGLLVSQEGLTGGSNQFPQGIEGAVPYFKSTYNAVQVTGTYNTMGQHVLDSHTINCYGVGDCLMGSQFLYASGGFRDEADEGAHPFDLSIQEDSRVFEGTCTAGCTTGSTSVTLTPTQGAGTQGEGRYLIDKNPANIINSGLLIGGAGGSPYPTASFSGISFPLTTFFATAQAIPSQANNIAPGSVTVAIATSGVTAGFATNTVAAPATSGVACVVDQNPSGNNLPSNYEMANYSVVDGTHLQLTLNKVHAALSTVAMGGLCGYGLEQTVDTAAGIRQVFPVVGSYSSTGLYYAGGLTWIAGIMNKTSGFLSANFSIASVARSGNLVTVTASGNLPGDINGLTMTVAGVSDSSYNGSFVVTTTGPNTLTYPQTGANSTSSNGTVSFLTGGYNLYPMAEVLGVLNPATKLVDGQMTLAPNTVQWASSDPVEQPHYFQEKLAADIELVQQTMPRPSSGQQAGIFYAGNNGPGLVGWEIVNGVPTSNYLGAGGTHQPPNAAYVASGAWQQTMLLDAGINTVFQINCNYHGCGRWNSGYDLFQLNSSAGADTIHYQPQTSTLNFFMRGTGYTFTPQAFTAGTINATTVNATTVNGSVSGASITSGAVGAAYLPSMGASGTTHAAGIVPDPGASAGTTRYLREDGSWSVPAGSGAGGGNLIAGATADYNFLQGSGSILQDTTGNGNNGTLDAGTAAPAWTATGMAFLPGQGVSLPATLNGTQSYFVGLYINPITAGTQITNQYPAILSSSAGGSGFNFLYDYSNGTNYLGFVYAPSLYVNSQHATEAPNLVSGFHVLAAVLGTGSGNVDHLYIDGVEVATYTTHGSSAGAQTTGNLFVGSSSVSPWLTSGINGTMYRLRAYPTQLTAANVQAVSAAIVNEVAARGVPVTPVNVALAAPQLHAIGDSITFGQGVATPWPSLLSLTNQAAYTTTDWGITGISLASITGSEPNRAALRCKSSSGPSLAVVFAGTNDFALIATTPAAVLSNLMGEVQTMKQAGCKVFVGTMVSRNGNDVSGNTFDADKDAYDTLILSQAKASGADGVIDFAANPLLGSDGANTGSYFQTDHIHPTQAGQALLAAAASNALNYAFGYNEASPHTVTALNYTMTAADGYISLSGLTAAGTLTLPDCTGQSGATYRVNNPQSAYSVSVAPLNANQPINGLTTVVTVPANATLTLRDVPNPKAVSGCHWEM